MMTFSYFLMTLLGFSGLFLIGLVLLQRGRGGGLAGAFGGMGGQSAFGTKAGDVFTKITIVVASAWILLCAGSVLALHYSAGSRISADITKKEDSSDSVKKAGAKKDLEGVPDGVVSPKGDEETKPAEKPKSEVGEKAEKDEDGAKKPAESAAPAKPGEEKPTTDEKSGENKKPADEKKPTDDEKPKGSDQPKDEQKPNGDEKPKDENEKAGDSKPESTSEPKAE